MQKYTHACTVAGKLLPVSKFFNPALTNYLNSLPVVQAPNKNAGYPQQAVTLIATHTANSINALSNAVLLPSKQQVIKAVLLLFFANHHSFTNTFSLPTWYKMHGLHFGASIGLATNAVAYTYCTQTQKHYIKAPQQKPTISNIAVQVKATYNKQGLYTGCTIAPKCNTNAGFTLKPLTTYLKHGTTLRFASK